MATELPENISDEEAQEAISSLMSEVDPLQVEDIAAAISYVITQPGRVSVNEILIRPTQQPS